MALREVDYLIDAHFAMTGEAGPADNVPKFVAIFERRLAKGQHFHQPYFGCREFVADVLPADGAPAPIEQSGDLGLMLWDIEYGAGRNRPVFFRARLDGGVLDVPENPEASLAATVGAEGGPR